MKEPGELTYEEIVVGAVAGVVRRAAHATKKGNMHRWNGNCGWQDDIPGALAELVVAKYLGRYWTGLELGKGDVAGVEVRWSAREDAHLLLHDEDPGRPHVLVTGDVPMFRMRGWALPDEVRRKAYWDDLKGGRPAYFVPQAALRPMATLEDYLLSI